MKRLGIAALLLISLSSCAQGQGGGDSRYGEREPGILTVGLEIPFEPFEYEADGALTGFDVDLIQAIADEIDLEVNFVKTDFERLVERVASGELDVAASAIRITEERAQKVAFVGPYYIANQVLIVNSQLAPDIGSLEDLTSEDRVVVQHETTGRDWAEENLAPRGVHLQNVIEATAAFDLLEAGRVTAFISDESLATTEVNNRSGLRVVQTIDTGERYGIAVNPRLTRLVTAMNQALERLIADGTYEKIYRTYEGLAPNGAVTARQPSP